VWLQNSAIGNNKNLLLQCVLNAYQYINKVHNDNFRNYDGRLLQYTGFPEVVNSTKSPDYFEKIKKCGVILDINLYSPNDLALADYVSYIEEYFIDLNLGYTYVKKYSDDFWAEVKSHGNDGSLLQNSSTE
jgi:hypothetical protein